LHIWPVKQLQLGPGMVHHFVCASLDLYHLVWCKVLELLLIASSTRIDFLRGQYFFLVRYRLCGVCKPLSRGWSHSCVDLDARVLLHWKHGDRIHGWEGFLHNVDERAAIVIRTPPQSFLHNTEQARHDPKNFVVGGHGSLGGSCFWNVSVEDAPQKKKKKKKKKTLYSVCSTAVVGFSRHTFWTGKILVIHFTLISINISENRPFLLTQCSE